MGVAQHMNLVVRRMQLATAARTRVTTVSPVAVLSPFPSFAKYRMIPRGPARFSSSHALLVPRLSSILRVPCASLQ
jgi:hypothetical protein